MKHLIQSALNSAFKSTFMPALLAASMLCTPLPAHAETMKLSFDKVHTQIIFFVDHLGFSKSEGEFHDFDGAINFDTLQPEKSNVEITIQTKSLDMDDKVWDEHMAGENFFNTASYPTMHFKSTAISVTGENTADITGDLTILGVTKPLTLKAVHNKTGKHPMNGKTIAGFSATASLKRSDFGMNYGLPMIGDDVEIRIEVESVDESSSGTNK